MPHGPLTPEPDASVADWVVERLAAPWDSPITVSTLVPDEFDAVVRIEHVDREDEGELDRATAEALVDLLRPATTTPDDVVFAVWPGWGDLPAEMFPGAATIEVPHRECFLLRGPIGALLHPIDIMAFGDTCRPAIWWPMDRAWVVVTEIDFSWTFVGGPQRLTQQIVDDPRIRATPTSPDAEAVGRWGRRRSNRPAPPPGD